MSRIPATSENLRAWVNGGPAPAADSVVRKIFDLEDLVARLQAKRPPTDDRELLPGVIRFKNMARLRAEGVEL